MTNPIEILQRPQFKSPPVVDIRSNAGQGFGRTTLSSGSSSVTVSTNMVNSDSVLSLNVQAALAAAFTTQGRMDIVSGAGYGTASTTAVFSGDVISAEADMLNVASGFGRGFKVSSVVDGVSFAIGTQDGLGPGAAAALIWKIQGKDPITPKVNTISPGNFFTVAWPDGVARPYDATLHWSLLRTS